jgi:hypothetical protein
MSGTFLLTSSRGRWKMPMEEHEGGQMRPNDDHDDRKAKREKLAWESYVAKFTAVVALALLIPFPKRY